MAILDAHERDICEKGFAMLKSCFVDCLAYLIKHDGKLDTKTKHEILEHMEMTADVMSDTIQIMDGTLGVISGAPHHPKGHMPQPHGGHGAHAADAAYGAMGDHGAYANPGHMGKHRY